MSPYTNSHRVVPEPVARPARTTIQGAIALGLVTLWSEQVDRLTRDEVGLYVLVVTAIVNSIMVLVENKTGFALLREVPPKSVPALDKPRRRRRRP